MRGFLTVLLQEKRWIPIFPRPHRDSSKPLFLGDGANHQFSRERRLDLRATDQAEKSIRCFTEFH